jgi:putative endonuclease
LKPKPTSKRAPRNDAERRAAWWYRLRGYRILDTNCWLAGGEVDIVARRGGNLIFCEVKSKSGVAFGEPLAMVDGVKARRVRRTAEVWLACHPETRGLEVRFDVIAEHAGKILHVPNAF